MYNNEIVFCESIGIPTYDKIYLQLFLWNNGLRKLFITCSSSFLVLVSKIIATVTYDHIYLQLLMLNNGQSKITYDK